VAKEKKIAVTEKLDDLLGVLVVMSEVLKKMGAQLDRIENQLKE
jgi:hypothetical protein